MDIPRRHIVKAGLGAGLLAGLMPWRAQGMMAPSPATPLGQGRALPDAAEVINLWPQGVGAGRLRDFPEVVTERSREPATIHDRALHGISTPRMAVFRPQKPNGAAVLITPGGGYVRVVIDREGYELAQFLAQRGFTCFVLFYRLPGEGWASGPETALIDAQRAIRLIRHRAATYGFDPAKVGTIGFSAGGHLCADLAARFATKAYMPIDEADAQDTRPYCAAPIYPVVSMTPPLAHAGSRTQLLGDAPTPEMEALHSPHRQIPADAPPHFIVHAEDDPAVPVGNSLALRDALKGRGIKVETHLFERGGHGFGLRNAKGLPAEIWPQLWLGWARDKGLFA
ncbi:alpha/beta hydrolase [Novosphingobium umbonatum]|nr:alpha/beta hydrolase [Novosphingobium umbonatum]